MEKQTKVKQGNVSFFKQYFLNDMKIRKKNPRIYLHLKAEYFIWHITIMVCFKEKQLFFVMLNKFKYKKGFFEVIGLQNSFFTSLALCCGFYWKQVEISWGF